MSDAQTKLAVLAPEKAPKRAPTLYFIVAVKFLKGMAATLLAVGAFKLTDKDLPEVFRKVLEFFHLDPGKRFFLDLADRIGEITPHKLDWIAVGSIAYSLLMFLQATGLALRVSWIVWLVIGESAFFIPVEIFDLVRKHTSDADHPHLINPKIVVAIVLAINVVIVWYLFRNRDRLIRHRHHH